MKKYNLLLFLTLFTLLAASLRAQDCDNDVTPPSALCLAILEVAATGSDDVTVFAPEIDAGSNDDCGMITMAITLADDDTGMPPATPLLNLPNVTAAYPVVLYVVDQSGNFNACFSVVSVTGEEDCTDDAEAPDPVCYNGITVSLGDDGTVTVFAQDIVVDPNDNCDDNPTLNINLEAASTGTPQGESSVVFDAPGVYNVETWAVDAAGNADYCVSSVTVTGGGSCTDDTTEPTTICEVSIAVEAVPDYGFLLWAQHVDEGSYDDCSTVELFLTSQADDDGTLPAGSSVLLPPVLGTQTVVLYAVDQAGNFNTCWTDVEVTGFNTEGCPSDTEPPALICLNDLSLSLNPATGIGIMDVSDFIFDVFDDCDPSPVTSVNLSSNSTGGPQGITELVFDTPGIYEVEVWAVDDFGNATFCVSTITVENMTPPDCDNDVIAPSIACEGEVYINTPAGETVTVNVEDLEVITYDACGEVEVRLIRAADSDGTLPTGTSVELPPVNGEVELEIWAVDESGNTNVCNTIVTVRVQYIVNGTIFRDDNDNCTLDGGETGAGDTQWSVRIASTNSDRETTVVTNASGEYFAYLSNWSEADLTDVSVELLLPDGLASGCVTSVIIPEVTDFETTVDFADLVVEDCIFTTVDVAMPFLRRCFDNFVYVQYTNYSDQTAEDAVVTVQLDPFITLNGAPVPYNDLGFNRYELLIGNLAPASTAFVILDVHLSCDAELGATHCVEATILPFTCPPGGGFAELTVTGECDDAAGQVNFTIANTGDTDMAAARDFRIVEDVIMYMTADPVQLDAGESRDFSYPANGATWRVEIDQEDDFPYGGVAAAFVEGCGGFTPGIATQFFLGNGKPNVDKLCTENVGSWDPNDKQALPRGYGEERFIYANTPLEYTIRFQNTGTDTAFNVRIEDQLSEHLDPTTLVPGAASHPYRLEMREGGLLSFHFDDIMLPDSSVNWAGSNGFVQFSIQQRPDHPIGTVIENTAGIYFDFNEAVITNTVTRTVGEDFVIVKTQDIPTPGVSLRVAPNPLRTATRLTVDGIDLRAGQCLLYDVQGRLVGQRPLLGQTVELARADFGAAGLYFYRLVEDGRVIAQGKLIVR